jgi:hypothetical protein
VKPHCTVLLILLLAAVPAWSGTTVTYDPGLGSLPDAQGYTFANQTSGAPFPSVAGGLLLQGPTSASDIEFWHREDISFAFNQGFSAEIKIQAVSSLYVPDVGDGSQRSGFYLECIDTTGRRMTLGIASSGLTVNTDGQLQPSNGIPFLTFDMTNAVHDIKLFTTADSIYLFIDGIRHAAIALGPPIFPSTARVVYFGDGTGAAGSQVKIALVRYSYPGSTVGVGDAFPPAARPLWIAPLGFVMRDGVDLVVRAGVDAAVGVRLYDVRGAIVRDLGQLPRVTGTRTLHWDGRDSSGRSAPAGVYFATARSHGESASCRLVVLR